MDLGYVFKVSLYSLTVLVGAILGFAESEGVNFSTRRFSLVLPFLSLPIVAFGYLYTERRRDDGSSGAGLNPGWANLLGILALIATGFEFTSENHEGKLLAGTHLLLYATWIVLFQQKTVRLYWFLMALGILQLAVASVLTTKGWFGFCALVYTFGAVWTLSIFSLWRAEQQFQEEEQTRFAIASPTSATSDDLPDRDVSLQSEVHGTVQHEDGTRWLTARFVTGVLLTTCSALLVSAAFFAFIPRVWVGAGVSLNEDSERMSGLGRRKGLASTIRLGDLGPILESLERVFSIQITNLKTHKVISAQEYAEQLGLAEPLFRAMILTTYKGGSWGVDPLDGLHHRPFEDLEEDWEIEQLIRREPADSGVLFCMGYPLIMRDSRRQVFGDLNELTGVAKQIDKKKEHGALAYTVYSAFPSVPPQHYQQPVSPPIVEAYSRSQYLERSRKIPSNLKRLQQLAQDIVEVEAERLQRVQGKTGSRRPTALEIASALESHLRDSGEYQYSLDLAIQDPAIDPIEDFLFNRKAGHCEYFATALALMLRAERIPARVVSGYKGGIVNPDRSDWLEVQQRFAHAWVEAWIDKVGWTTFDATPVEGRSSSIAAMIAKKGSVWSEMQSTLAGLWSDNVLNMSLDRQEESIYRPIRELAMSLFKFFRELIASPQSALQTIIEICRNRERWFSLGGGLFAVGLMLSLTGIGWLIKLLVIKGRNWLSGHSGRRNQQRRRVVEFYDRFISLMKKHGLQRAPDQTQNEFAEMVSCAYSPELAAIGLTGFPMQITQLFYRVRFGEEDLSRSDANRMEELLAALETVLPREGSPTGDRKGQSVSKISPAANQQSHR